MRLNAIEKIIITLLRTGEKVGGDVTAVGGTIQ
jgi:hypothetical protein